MVYVKLLLMSLSLISVDAQTQHCLEIESGRQRCWTLDSSGRVLKMEERQAHRLSPYKALYLHEGKIQAYYDWPAKFLELFSKNQLLERLDGRFYQSFIDNRLHVSCKDLDCQGPFPIIQPDAKQLREGDWVFTANYSPYSGRSRALFTHGGVVHRNAEQLQILGNDIMQAPSSESLNEAFYNTYSYLVVRPRQATPITTELQAACTLWLSGQLQNKYGFQPDHIFEALYPEILAQEAAERMPVVTAAIPQHSSVKDWITHTAPRRRSELMADWETIRQNPQTYMENLLKTRLPLQPLLYHPRQVEGFFRFIALQEALGLTGFAPGFSPAKAMDSHQ